MTAVSTHQICTGDRRLLATGLLLLVSSAQMVLWEATAQPREGLPQSTKRISQGQVTLEEPKPLSLEEAVAALNKKMGEMPFDVEAMRAPALAPDRRPAACTEAEVIGVIQKWDRAGQDADKSTHDLLRGIAALKRLLPGSVFDCVDQWLGGDEQDKYEYRTFRILLHVMTSANTGYTLEVRSQKLDQRLALRATPSYAWIMEPFPLRAAPSPSGMIDGRFVVWVERDRGEALVATVAYSPKPGVEELHPVVFDVEGNRHALDRERMGGATQDVILQRFRLDPAELEAAQARFIGIQGISKEGLKAASQEAVRRAKEKGIAVLPLPEVGSPFEFRLVAVEGTVIDSVKLRGKVVLVDCWASWCGPCLRMMPELKALYAKWHPQGLEVIGVSFDENADAARALAKRQQIPWPWVQVPSGVAERLLWTAATRVSSLPRVFVIDSKGILRFDLTSAPWNIEPKIRDLLGGK